MCVLTQYISVSNYDVKITQQFKSKKAIIKKYFSHFNISNSEICMNEMF